MDNSILYTRNPVWRKIDSKIVEKATTKVFASGNSLINIKLYNKIWDRIRYGTEIAVGLGTYFGLKYLGSRK